MNAIDFNNNQWHIQGSKEIVEVRRTHEPPNELFSIFVREQPIYENLPRNDHRVLLAALIQKALPNELVSLYSQTLDYFEHMLQQQHQAAQQQQNQQVNDPGQLIVAEIAAEVDPID